MDDLIRRSDVIEALGDRPENWTDSDEEIQACADWDAFRGIASRLPAVDAVEVVRCPSCKHHVDIDGYHGCRKLRMRCPNDAEFFCKYGQRREDGDA